MNANPFALAQRALRLEAAAFFGYKERKHGVRPEGRMYACGKVT